MLNRGVLISGVVKNTNEAFGTDKSVLFMEVSAIQERPYSFYCTQNFNRHYWRDNIIVQHTLIHLTVAIELISNESIRISCGLPQCQYTEQTCGTHWSLESLHTKARPMQMCCAKKFQQTISAFMKNQSFICTWSLST